MSSSNNLPGTELAAGTLVLVILAALAIHTFLFFWGHIYYIDGQNYVIYERFWTSRWFKKTLSLPTYGRTFTTPLISRIKTDSKGRVVQFSQKEIKDLIEFTNIFSNNGAIVKFSFYLDYKINDIDKFIKENKLEENCDHSVFIDDFKMKLKKEFKNQKLLELRTDWFQQWGEKVKNEFDFEKYGIQCHSITLKDADIKVPLVSNPKSISDIKKLLGIH